MGSSNWVAANVSRMTSFKRETCDIVLLSFDSNRACFYLMKRFCCCCSIPFGLSQLKIGSAIRCYCSTSYFALAFAIINDQTRTSAILALVGSAVLVIYFMLLNGLLLAILGLKIPEGCCDNLLTNAMRLHQT